MLRVAAGVNVLGSSRGVSPLRVRCVFTKTGPRPSSKGPRPKGVATVLLLRGVRHIQDGRRFLIDKSCRRLRLEVFNESGRFFATCFILLNVRLCTRRFRTFAYAPTNAYLVLTSAANGCRSVRAARDDNVNASVFLSTMRMRFFDRGDLQVTNDCNVFRITRIAKFARSARRATLLIRRIKSTINVRALFLRSRKGNANVGVAATNARRRAFRQNRTRTNICALAILSNDGKAAITGITDSSFLSFQLCA